MKNRNFKDLGKELALVGLVGTVLGMGAFTAITSISQSKHKEAAKYISMQDYMPVGNGGAIAEFHGYISPERRKMYDEIPRIYWEKMLCDSPNNVLREAEILKDTNLSTEEKNQRIGELYSFKYKLD